MKNTSTGLGSTIKSESQESAEAVRYRNIAGGLANEMLGFIRPSESRKCSPPFKMVIIGKCGTVVFECKVSKSGKVRPFGSERKVEHSHFPATALLTDSSFVTRTFLIDIAASSPVMATIECRSVAQSCVQRLLRSSETRQAAR